MGELRAVPVSDVRGAGPSGPRARAYLVDRLWPRGVRKDEITLDGWLREVAPSTELRRWFGHDPDRWEEFRRRYAEELDANRQTWEPLLEGLGHGDVLLVFSARDHLHNNAVALRDYLLDHEAAR